MPEHRCCRLMSARYQSASAADLGPISAGEPVSTGDRGSPAQTGRGLP
jgi:hypothetical protein